MSVHNSKSKKGNWIKGCRWRKWKVVIPKYFVLAGHELVHRAGARGKGHFS